MSIHLIQPDANAYTQWDQSDILRVEHKPRGTMVQRSLGEGYHLSIKETYIAEELAKCFAGFLQVRDGANGLRYGVLRINPEGTPRMAIHPFHVVKYRSVMDEREVPGPSGMMEKQKVEIGHESGGLLDHYVLEGEKAGLEFMQELQRGSLSLLLHEGIHPHRGDLPKFVHWLESVNAIPKIK